MLAVRPDASKRASPDWLLPVCGVPCRTVGHDGNDEIGGAMGNGTRVTMMRPVPADDRLRAAGREAAAPFDRTEPMRLALVANGKPNSVELLDALADELARHLDVAEVRRYRKASVSVPPDDADIAEIGEWANAVLAAVGD